MNNIVLKTLSARKLELTEILNKLTGKEKNYNKLVKLYEGMIEIYSWTEEELNKI